MMCNRGVTSDHIKHGGNELGVHAFMFLSAVVSHGSVPNDLPISTIIPIPKCDKSNFTAGALRVEANLQPLPAQFLSMHNKKMFDPENIGQGHGAQHSQWSRSIARINLYKSHT